MADFIFGLIWFLMGVLIGGPALFLRSVFRVPERASFWVSSIVVGTAAGWGVGLLFDPLWVQVVGAVVGVGCCVLYCANENVI